MEKQIQWFTLIPHSLVLQHMTGLNSLFVRTHLLTDTGQLGFHLSAMPWVSFTSSSSQPLKVDVPKDSICRFLAGLYLLLIVALSSLSGQMSHNSITSPRIFLWVLNFQLLAGYPGSLSEA